MNPDPAPQKPSDVAQLLSRHIELAKIEMAIEFRETFRRLKLFLFSALLFSVGFCFLQIAIFMGLIHLGLPTWVASILLGTLYIGGAGFLIYRLARRNPALGSAFEGTIQECQRSVEWISKRFF